MGGIEAVEHGPPPRPSRPRGPGGPGRPLRCWIEAGILASITGWQSQAGQRGRAEQRLQGDGPRSQVSSVPAYETEMVLDVVEWSQTPPASRLQARPERSGAVQVRSGRSQLRGALDLQVARQRVCGRTPGASTMPSSFLALRSGCFATSDSTTFAPQPGRSGRSARRRDLDLLVDEVPLPGHVVHVDLEDLDSSASRRTGAR